MSASSGLTGVLGSTGEASTSTTTSESTGGTGSSTSGGPPPGNYVVPAAIATCVFVQAGQAGFAGPAVCSQNATTQNGTGLTGLMQIDTQVVKLDGQNRPAHSFLRFDIPADLASLKVGSATLKVQVADGPDDLPNGPQSGVLRLTGAFDGNSLNSGEPAQLMELAGDMGFVNTNQVVVWSIPTDLVVPGQPLFLGLFPTDTDGVIYRGATTPGAPTLDLVMQ